MDDIGRILDGCAAVNLAEPSEGDLRRVTEAYSRLRDAHRHLEDKLAFAIEALENCQDEICDHTECHNNMESKPAMHRDWCRCGNWVYRGQVNPATTALTKLKENR
jgi:hypothetical protein